MIRVAILDDYQKVSMKYIEPIKLKNKYQLLAFRISRIGTEKDRIIDDNIKGYGSCL